METVELGTTMVELSEQDGKQILRIMTEDADVHINGQLVWAKYDNPFYRHIPPVLRDYIKRYEDYMEEHKEELAVDLYHPELTAQASWYIPHNIIKPIKIRFDYLNSLDEFETDSLRNCTAIAETDADRYMQQLRAIDGSIKATCSLVGYTFVYSHASEGFSGWWDIVFPLDKWDEQVVNDLWGLIDQFNKILREINAEYGIY